MNLRECCNIIGADYSDLIRRFLSEERSEKFFKMFLNDQSFNQLCDAMETEAYDKAFRMAHTMKGICMNLSLNTLLVSCKALTENLRSGCADNNTSYLFEQLKKDYISTSDGIRCYLDR